MSTRSNPATLRLRKEYCYSCTSWELITVDNAIRITSYEPDRYLHKHNAKRAAHRVAEQLGLTIVNTEDTT